MKHTSSHGSFQEPWWWKLLPVASVALFLAVWHGAALCNPAMLPTPVETIRSLFDMLFFPTTQITLLDHVWASLRRVLIAYGLATLSGVLLGVLFGWSRNFHDFVYPIFELLRPIPPIAWIPLIIMWLGIGEGAKIAICFIGSFIPVVVNTFFGFTTLDRTYLKAAQVLGARQKDLLLEVVLPGIFPNILAGMKVALSAGWLCVIAAEMIAAREGLGYLIVRSMESGNMLNILVALIFIGSISALLSFLFSKLEKVVCPW